MKYIISSSLSDDVYKFLLRETAARYTTRSKIIEEALHLYEQKKIEQEVEQGFKERYEEYRKINEEFSDIQRRSINLD